MLDKLRQRTLSKVITNGQMHRYRGASRIESSFRRMKTLTKLALTLLKLSGVFVAFGYISLKAHLNVLGIPWDYPLGVERCLAEAYQLAVETIAPILPRLPRLTVWAAVVCVLVGIVSRWKRLKSLYPPMDKFFRKLRSGWVLPAILILLASLAFYPLMLRDVDFALTAHFVGPITGFSYYHMPGLFSALVVLCLVIYGIYDSFGAEGFQSLTRSARICWRIVAALVALFLFFAPVVYGTLWHPMRYPVIKVSLKGSQPVQCGVLILRGDTDILLWRAAQGRGELLTIPSGEIHAFTAGADEDIRKWVEKAMDSGGPSPDCSQISDPPTDSH
jgi:hypothetical protein